MTNQPVRRFGSAAICAAMLVVIAGLLASGCGGGDDVKLGYKGAPMIYPETANVAPGGSTTFHSAVLEVDQHKKTEAFRLQENDGGSFVDATNPIHGIPPGGYPSAVLYTAPTKPGTYHIQWVWDAGTKNEKSATATITVTNTPPYTPLDVDPDLTATPSP